METIQLKNNKELNVFGQIGDIDPSAMAQMYEAMSQDYVVKGAVMPDCHKGYTLPIGAVVACEGVVVPSYVGYDIGCGVCAVKTNIKRTELHSLTDLHQALHDAIPVGTQTHKSAKRWDAPNRTKMADKIYKKRKGAVQLGTLGGGNHFLEVGYDQDDNVWISIHSGSRGCGHGIAEYYMGLASGDQSNSEGHFPFDVESENGKDYILDLNFALQYALKNRRAMMDAALNVLNRFSKVNSVKELKFINRNHNHAELKDGLWIHRKGATHAEAGMEGVIPGNMRDGVFIVCGLGNVDSLCSSSHGAGRVMGRYKAKKVLNVETFEKQMEGIVANVSKGTLDESPDAYKNIFDVMDAQVDLVEVMEYIKPLVSVKG